MASSSQIPIIYRQAIARYKEITKNELDVAFFSRLRSVDDLTSEVDARNSNFSEFREKRHIIFDSLSIAMKPIELVGNLAAGGASMAFPPSSLVFGAVSYLINAAKGASASYNAIQELMRTLKDFTIRLKVYSREQISNELSNKLSDVLVTLIEIFALSTKAIKGGRILKFTRNVIMGSDDQIQGCVGKLDNLTKAEAGLVGAETLTEAKRSGRVVDGVAIETTRTGHVVDNIAVTVTSTSVKVQETAQGVNQMSLEVMEVHETLGDVLLKVNELGELKKATKEDADKAHQYLVKKALQPSKTNTARDFYDRINKSRVMGTGDWIRGEDVFESWIRKDVPIIFVSGNPGAGKSFLSSNIISYLREQHPQGVQHPSHVSIGYFFFKDDNPSTRSFHQALRDLSYQISQNDPVYEKYLSSAVDDYESISTLESAWRTLFVDYFLTNKDVESSVYILFDGVDEAFDAERHIFLNLVKDIHDAGDHARIQLAMVGRPQIEDQILEALETESLPIIHVTFLKNSADIEQYIKSSIQKSVILKRVSVKLRDEIVKKLSSGAQGMFIWVDLMLKELLKKRNESSMRKSLDLAPKGLKEMLCHVLESFSLNSNEEELEYLNEMLAWTACAPRAFKLGEIETILKLKSPDGEGMIYPEGALRKQFASFFILNREDRLSTAELQNPHRYQADEEDEPRGEAFEDVENETDFDSNKETTEVTFCHASIGNFFRDESQGKISAGEGHIPIGVDFHTAKFHALKTCLKLFCDPEFAGKVEEGIEFMRKYAVQYWITHLRSVELSKAKPEDKAEIARLLAKMFSHKDTLESWTSVLAWHSSNDSLKLVRQWWEDQGVVDSLPQEERDFVTLTASAPATTFKPAAMEYARKWFALVGNPAFHAGAVISFVQFENGTNADSSSINWKPLPKDTIEAAKWCGKEKTAIWYRAMGVTIRNFGNYDTALEYFLESDKMDPNEWLTKAGLAKVYVLKKEWQKAIEMDEPTEQVLLKMIKDEPSKAKEYKTSMHDVQERIGDSYAELNDKTKMFAAFKRAIAGKPGCDHCQNVILLHNNEQRLYQDTIDLLKTLQNQQVPGKDYSLLTASLWENPYIDVAYFQYCADAALETGELKFLVEAYRDAIRAAKKEAKNIVASWLELSLAELYKVYMRDEKKAVHTWERIVDTFAASKDEDEIGAVKVVASGMLAKYYIFQAELAGVGTMEAEKYGKRLEKVTKKKTSDVQDAASFIPANVPAMLLGLWYRLSGRHEEARAFFLPSIKEAIQILSDDDPDNDIDGLFELLNTLLAAGDDRNVIALSYYAGVYRDDKLENADAQDVDKASEGTDLDTDAKGASTKTEGDEEDKSKESEGIIPDEDIRMTCDGPCRRWFTILDTFSFCRYCYDTSFCEDCVKLLNDGKMLINVCSQRHTRDFLFIPKRPQSFGEGKTLLEGKVVDFEEWRDDLKKEWKA